jgi:hypothetical protein
MRWLLGLALVIVAAGCGGSTTQSVGQPVAKHLHRCTHASSAFRACSTFGSPIRGERSWIQHRQGATWMVLAGPPRGRYGWWRRIVASADGKTLLAQWSGECEIQSTYLISTVTGKEQPVFGGAASTAVGWSEDGRARVRLLAPLYGIGNAIRYEAGIYRVEPRTACREPRAHGSSETRLLGFGFRCFSARRCVMTTIALSGRRA